VSGHASAVGRRIEQDEKARCRSGTAAEAFGGEAAREPQLDVVPAQGLLDRGEFCLHLDHEDDAGAAAGGKHVDGTTLTEVAECHLRRDLPAVPTKPVRNQADDDRMSLVEQAVERTAAPAHLEPKIGFKAGKDPPQGTDRDLVEMAPLDQRDSALGQAGGSAQVLLAKPAPTAERPERTPDAEIVHEKRSSSTGLDHGLPAACGRLHRAACHPAPPPSEPARLGRRRVGRPADRRTGPRSAEDAWAAAAAVGQTRCVERQAGPPGQTSGGPPGRTPGGRAQPRDGRAASRRSRT
jgi:hypothetical protein